MCGVGRAAGGGSIVSRRVPLLGRAAIYVPSPSATCQFVWQAYRYIGPVSVAGIAIGYGLDGPVIESQWGRDFPRLSRPALGPTQLPVQWVPGLSWGKERPGRDADPSPLLVPWSRKSRAINLLPLGAVWPVHSLSACTMVHFYLSIDIQHVRQQLWCWEEYLDRGGTR